MTTAAVHTCELFLPPPTRFPYIHSLTFTTLSFVCFGAAAVYCNWRQWQVPAAQCDGGEERDDEEEEEEKGRNGVARRSRTTTRTKKKQHVE